MLKKKHTAEEKYQAIAECGKSSIHAVAKKYEIGTTTLREWIAKHESMGISSNDNVPKQQVQDKV